ncbi:MAG: M20/M25/M40 family metallo-hydrolase [Rhizobiales bacterium]|nr:M20/M25/M40 family metallo-hydrolase [Hyphomicrobiales bacterium]
MPPGNLSSWHSDPYCLTRADSRLRGLGAADMKTAIAAMLFAAARIARAPESEGTLTLVFSADEENGSSYGMEWLAQQGLLVADGAAMTEPSGLGQNSWQRLFIAQRGHCVAWLVARGVPGHSGELLSRDQRASYAFVKALNALLEADPFAEWVHPVDGTRPTVNVATMVEGGMVPFAHPESLRACLEVRVIEGMTEELVIGRLREVIVRAGLSDRVTVEPASPPLNWISPGEQVRDKRLLDAAKFAWRKVLGREPILAVMTAGTDSSHANAAGIPALPAFGPGSLGVAHKPNESLPEEDIGLAIDIFETFIRAYHRETQYV